MPLWRAEGSRQPRWPSFGQENAPAPPRRAAAFFLDPACYQRGFSVAHGKTSTERECNNLVYRSLCDVPVHPKILRIFEIFRILLSTQRTVLPLNPCTETYFRQICVPSKVFQTYSSQTWATQNMRFGDVERNDFTVYISGILRAPQTVCISAIFGAARLETGSSEKCTILHLRNNRKSLFWIF